MKIAEKEIEIQSELIDCKIIIWKDKETKELSIEIRDVENMDEIEIESIEDATKIIEGINISIDYIKRCC